MKIDDKKLLAIQHKIKFSVSYLNDEIKHMENLRDDMQQSLERFNEVIDNGKLDK